MRPVLTGGHLSQADDKPHEAHGLGKPWFEHPCHRPDSWTTDCFEVDFAPLTNGLGGRGLTEVFDLQVGLFLQRLSGEPALFLPGFEGTKESPATFSSSYVRHPNFHSYCEGLSHVRSMGKHKARDFEDP